MNRLSSTEASLAWITDGAFGLGLPQRRAGRIAAAAKSPPPRDPVIGWQRMATCRAPRLVERMAACRAVPVDYEKLHYRGDHIRFKTRLMRRAARRP